MAISAGTSPDERELVGTVRLDDAWALVEDFSHLIRESGTEPEAEAVRLIVSRLESWGVPHVVHHPECWISLPGRAALTIKGRSYRARTPSMAASTPPEGLTAPATYVAGRQAGSVDDLFATGTGAGEVAGRIVVTEGMPMPGTVVELESRGAVGVVCISPGARIHEGICTPIWGSPDLTSWPRQPRIPVVSVSAPDGAELRARVREGTVATMVAEHDTRWRPIPVIVAEVHGSIEPERFVLVHGHLDSWYVGIGDNATGDATLLELARVLQAARDRLARSVRICWWSGHSHGRYAGSTWYADAFALDLIRNCICHLNCDSPGCRDATAYEHVYWMAELATFAQEAIRDFTGLPAQGRPPIRAGDISFNNLGVSTCFMLSSTMPERLRRERRLYAVGGCGGNIEWHTEADTIEVADRENLLRDMRLYVGAAFRAANRPVHPLDLGATLDQIESVVDGYRDRLEGLVDLTSLGGRLDAARRALARLSAIGQRIGSVRAARPVNDALLRAARALVPVLYAREGRHRQDLALDIPLLPDFAATAAARGSIPEGVLRTELTRARNRLEMALLEVEEAALGATGA